LPPTDNRTYGKRKGSSKITDSVQRINPAKGIRLATLLHPDFDGDDVDETKSLPVEF
jgi:hypothetical protein